jgi:hypothetical protein
MHITPFLDWTCNELIPPAKVMERRMPTPITLSPVIPKPVIKRLAVTGSAKVVGVWIYF